MGKIKTYFEDYKECQRVCADFQREHWFGNTILSITSLMLCVGGIYCWAAVRELIDEKNNEDDDEN